MLLPRVAKYPLKPLKYNKYRRIKENSQKVRYGQGWGEDVLSNCRKFFIAYSASQISDTACRELPESDERSNFRHSVSEIQTAPCRTPQVRFELESLVELTLPKDSNIYAAQYELYLPDKKELQTKLKSWIEEFEEQEKL